ncbi:hypothetical protein CDS [Bradyrhizobium sp.]|nr:hypothetical protein CDS [Bradyrhizobium sp.]
MLRKDLFDRGSIEQFQISSIDIGLHSGSYESYLWLHKFRNTVRGVEGDRRPDPADGILRDVMRPEKLASRIGAVDFKSPIHVSVSLD